MYRKSFNRSTDAKAVARKKARPKLLNINSVYHFIERKIRLTQIGRSKRRERKASNLILITAQSSSFWHFHVLECFIARTHNNRGQSLNTTSRPLRRQQTVQRVVLMDLMIKLLQFNLWLFWLIRAYHSSDRKIWRSVWVTSSVGLARHFSWNLLHNKVSWSWSPQTLARFNYCFHVFLFCWLALMIYWLAITSSLASSSYLDAFVGVLNWAEKESPIDQRITIVYQHDFLAENARHVSLLVSGEWRQYEHSGVVVSMLSFVLNLPRENENVKTFLNKITTQKIAMWSRKSLNELSKQTTKLELSVYCLLFRLRRPASSLCFLI